MALNHGQAAANKRQTIGRPCPAAPLPLWKLPQRRVAAALHARPHPQPPPPNSPSVGSAPACCRF